MVKNVLIIKNSTLEGPGLIEHVLMENDICWDIIDLESGDEYPAFKKYKAVFVLGGPDSANDKTLKIQEELKKIGQVLDLGIPYLGICLGMQLLIKANKGKVERCSISEIGWKDLDNKYFKVSLTEEGQKDPLFSGIEGSLRVFHLHNETIRLSRSTRLLGTGSYCKNQIVNNGSKSYGIQGHIELTKTMLVDWVTYITDFKHLKKDSIVEDYFKLQSEYEKVGKRVIENFLRISKLI